MSDVIGVELGADSARAVAFSAWRKRPHGMREFGFDPARPHELVVQLRAHFGTPRRLALSVGLAHLQVKHVKLPPAPAIERRRMIVLEPDRFFPVQDTRVAVALASEADYAFAMDAALLDRWLAAFSSYAPVDAIEPAPLSLVRALERGASGTYTLPAAEGEQGAVAIQRGAFIGARRAPLALVQPSAPWPAAQAGIPGEFLCAAGVAGAVTEPLERMLLDDAQARTLRGRRTRRVTMTALLCMASFLLAFWAVDRARERTLLRLTAEVAAVTPQAAAALELEQRLASSERATRAAAALSAQRADPLGVLQLLGALPADATVLNLRAQGNNWQIDGRAADAAAIVALLARNPQLEDVRFLSASSRFREDDRTYETFSIAFRVRASS